VVQQRRNKKAAVRFFRHLLKGQGGEPRWLFTDKLRSYDAAHREVMPEVETYQYGLCQRAVNYRLWHTQSFQVWKELVCA